MKNKQTNSNLECKANVESDFHASIGFSPHWGSAPRCGNQYCEPCILSLLWMCLFMFHTILKEYYAVSYFLLADPYEIAFNAFFSLNIILLKFIHAIT